MSALRQGQVAAVMVDRLDIAVVIAEAVAAMADQFHLVVHPFQRAVGNAQKSVNKNRKIGDRLLFPRFTGLVGRRISAVEFVKE